MKTFVISLKRSQERRDRIENLLNELSIEFNFHDAVDANTPNFQHADKVLPEVTKKRFGYHLINNEVGCFASHYSIWEKCISINEPILVIEDNIEATENFLKYLPSLEELTNKYQLIKLSVRKYRKCKTIESLDKMTDIVTYNKLCYGTQAYTITPAAAKKLIKGANYFIEPVDNYMEKTWKHGVPIYCFKPNIIDRADVQSTIGKTRKNKQDLKLYKKFYIELYRLYEQCRLLLKN